ncbi:MAG: SPFH domain-containing protein, partial [Acidobacteriota bacterium]
MTTFAFALGLLLYVLVRVGLGGFFTVRPDQRAVITSFGRAQRLPGAPVADPSLSEDERRRYSYPNLRVIQPGGPYLKMPWQKVHKVSVATQAVDLVWD